VFSCFASDKALSWGHKIGGAILGNPFLAGGYVYIASSDRSLYKFAAADGRLAWRYRTESPLASGPVVIGGIAYQYSPGQGLLAIDAELGTEIWRAANGMAFICRVDNRIAVRDSDNEIQLLEADSGKLKATFPMGNRSSAVTNVLNDALYLVGPRGRTLCLRAQDAPYLHPSRIAAARARLNTPPQTGPGDGDDALLGNVKEDRTSDPLRSRRDRGRDDAGQ
jgi:hypothetical protein